MKRWKSYVKWTGISVGAVAALFVVEGTATLPGDTGEPESNRVYGVSWMRTRLPAASNR